LTINTLFAVGSKTPVLFQIPGCEWQFGDRYIQCHRHSRNSAYYWVRGRPKDSTPRARNYVDVRLTNTGTGNARNLKITLINLRTLSGTGTVKLQFQPVPTVTGYPRKFGCGYFVHVPAIPGRSVHSDEVLRHRRRPRAGCARHELQLFDSTGCLSVEERQGKIPVEGQQ